MVCSVAVDHDDVLTAHTGGRQPRVDGGRVVRGEHPERVAGGVADIELGDVKPELANLFS